MKGNRCDWGDHAEMKQYHDEEWGRPEHDDKKLYEHLMLDVFQAGLNWLMIMRKRDAFREAFDGFDPAIVAKYGNAKVEKLMRTEGIVRNRAKIEAAIVNAKALLEVQKEFGSFDKYVWGFVGGKPVHNKWKSLNEIPSSTKVAEQMSEDLKSRGFKFVGPTVVYSFMQASGIVNDHILGCEQHEAVKAGLKKKAKA
ncbi:MAG TPA: DNA-3-methyladenine glycosylase I [Methanomassiliicoccales archaeon]|nr:DNA-3-methyladenine glycosylase I [Methanomassiliicoccales archaeon]